MSSTDTSTSPLYEYAHKRDFQKTDEPRATRKSKGSGDYMIHLHDATRLHYDLRLQWKGVLKCWAVPKGPSLNPKDKRLAVRTEDHPDDYKNYEGVIPEHHYGAGPSLIWDAGTFTPLEDFDEGFKKGHLRFKIDGVKLKGAWSLIEMKGQKKENWLLIKEHDEFASTSVQVEEMPESVATGRTLEDLMPSKRPQKDLSDTPAEGLKPQLALRKTKLPTGSNWQYERKYDGYRLLAVFNQGEVTLQTRNNKDWSQKFPQLLAELKKLPIDDVILDGEVVHFDKDGVTDFSKMQNFLNDKSVSLKFVLFDVLQAAGQNLQQVPLHKRRTFLEELFKNFPQSEMLMLSETLEPSKDILKTACRKKWEGIVAKKKDSSYHNFRHGSWVKVKCGNRKEFVVIGVTQPQGAREHFGSLLIAEETAKGLKYSGRVGTGFDKEKLKNLIKTFKPYETETPPDVEGLNRSDVKMWIKPHFYAEIDYSERTVQGLLRHPVYYGLRQDKEFEKEETTEEGAPSVSIQLTHSQRVLYPDEKITKDDVWNYYEQVMPEFLKFSHKAPLTLVRCPRGLSKDCFFQKHFNEGEARIPLIKIQEEKKTGIYGYLESEEDVKSLVQLGVLEFHLWNSRVPEIEAPKYLVFDLDPSEGSDFGKVVEAAHLLRGILKELNKESYARTSGGKGLHVLTACPEMSWEDAHEFSKQIAEGLAKARPKQFVSQSSKTKRKGKIFVDYLRNTRGATAIANFSTRAKDKATVATPLDWKEVTNNLNPQDFTIKSIPERLSRLKRDPWENFWKELKL